jgi:antitoxin component YwqK of YwqJK toxin-antitoxin module
MFMAALGLLPAQSNRDEFNLLKQYELPSHAVELGQLRLEEGVHYQGSEPFSGIAYEAYPNRQLLRVVNLSAGLQHGPMYIWYPDGTPQMSANYRQGRLHGRFLGWYANGGIIYDMVINSGGYAGDFIEDDRAQAAEDTGDAEREGSTSDSQRE